MTIDNFRRTDVVLDKANGYILDEQFGKVGDIKGRDFVVQITNDGVVQDQSGLKLVLAWTHNQVKNTGIEPFEELNVQQGIFKVTYPAEMMNEGTVTANIGVVQENGTTFTRNFTLRVEKNAGNADAAITNDSWTVLVEALEKVNEAEQLLKDTIAGLEGKYGSSIGDMKAFRGWDPTIIAKMSNEFTDRGVNVKWFGAVGDGVTDDTAAFESAITAAKDYSGRVVIGNGTYLINLTLTTSGITLTGGGTIKGSIDLDSPIDADNKQPSLDFKITDLNFKSNGTSDYAIGLNKARDGVISNCTFDNTVSKAVKFVGTPTYNQMSARINVINCRFNGDYAFYCVHNTAYFPLADIKFNDNVCQNKIANIHIVGVDGLALSGNTLFLPGNAKRDLNKEQNIYIRRGIWITIDAANHLFEAGLEGILLDQCQSPVINGISIAWPGQRKPSDGIRVIGGDMEGKSTVMGTITGCNIIFPTKNGISVEGVSGDITITANRIKSAGYSGYFYGPDDLSSINHYGIVTDSTTSRLLITGNNSSENNNNILGQTNYYADNFDVDKNVKFKNRVFELNTTDTVISVKGRDTIFLNQPQSVNLKGFVDGYDGQDVMLIALNANTKILASAVYLNNHADLNLSVGYAIKISYQGGNWYQIGGNI